jgi:molecular chaperone GrpE (heat shock protein)
MGAEMPSTDDDAELGGEAVLEQSPNESPPDDSDQPRGDGVEEHPAESEATAPPLVEQVVADFGSRLEEAQRLLARQSDLVDRLHAENQELRAGELRNAQLPLIRDLVRLHDDVERMRGASGQADHDLRVVQESLLDVLARNGVVPYAPDQGEEFDPRLHAVAGTEPTTDGSLDRSVVGTVRKGFRWDSGDVVRVAEVRAYRHRKPGPDERREVDTAS